MAGAELLERIEVGSSGERSSGALRGRQAQQLLAGAKGMCVAATMVSAHGVDEQREAVEQRASTETGAARQSELCGVEDDHRRARRELSEGRGPMAVNAHLTAASFNYRRLLSRDG
jgi:hypothetical protein